MAESIFLKDLPSFNEKNFMVFNCDYGVRTYSKRPSIYLSTKDIPSKQIIVNEKTIVAMKYIHEKWDEKYKNIPRKEGVWINEDKEHSRKKTEPNCSLA